MTELEYLKRLYTIEKKSLREIGAIIGRDHHWVKRRLVSIGITIKSYNKPLVKKQCEVCKQLFTPSRQSRRFCSHKCRGRAKELGLFSRKDERPIVVRMCPTCEQEFSCRDYSPQKYCCRKCFDISHSERMADKGNPSYIDGSSYNKRCFRGSNWDIIRTKVYERDAYICQSCGIKCIGRDQATPDTRHAIIQCHHIIPYQSIDDNGLSNLITLCVRCHSMTHGNN